MDKEILYEILKSKSETLSTAEIESILNEELDKSQQDMDTDLIDLCLDALNHVDKEKLNKRKTRFRLGKVLAAAAIFAIVIGLTIPVCAKYLSMNVPQGIVTVYKDCFNIDLSKDKYIFDICGQLEQDGIENAALPSVIFESSTKISNYSSTKGDKNISCTFDFSNDGIEGNASIEKYDKYGFDFGKSKASLEFEKIESLNVNGVTVLVFGNDEISSIKYIKDNIEYNISIKCDYKTACQIAKTI